MSITVSSAGRQGAGQGEFPATARSAPLLSAVYGGAAADSRPGYSADTEILTRDRSWVTLDQLDASDLVATRSPARDFEWQAPESVTWRPHRGTMVWFHGRALDLLVTPNHSVPYVPDRRAAERTVPAWQLLARGEIVPRPRAAAGLVTTSTWAGDELAGNQFAAFMGMYVAEGSAIQTVNDWRVLISQTEGGKGWSEYKELLTSIFGRKPTRNGGNWVIWGRALAEYLMPLGKAPAKWLPADVLNLSRRQLEIFWRYYWLGDGSYATGNQQVVATASKALAGGLQEIIQKLGWSAVVRPERTRPTPLVRASGLIYKLGVCQTPYPCGAVSGLPYDGMVGHVTVPNEVTYGGASARPGRKASQRAASSTARSPLPRAGPAAGRPPPGKTARSPDQSRISSRSAQDGRVSSAPRTPAQDALQFDLPGVSGSEPVQREPLEFVSTVTPSRLLAQDKYNDKGAKIIASR